MMVPGLYIYDHFVWEIARNLEPSSRGELEITDINRQYLATGNLRAKPLPPHVSWWDCGTCDELLDAANFVKKIRMVDA